MGISVMLVKGNFERKDGKVEISGSTFLSVNSMLEEMLDNAQGLHDTRIDPLSVYWCAYFISRWCIKQPFNLDALDKRLISDLHKTGYSIRDIGLVVNRSNASIHEYISKL